MEPLTSEELSAVAAACERLRSRHRLALPYRLGVDAVQPLTLRETGQRLGVSPERARQLANATRAELVRALARAEAGCDIDRLPAWPTFEAQARRLNDALAESLPRSPWQALWSRPARA